MSKFTGQSWKRGTGTVTVLETQVHHASARHAKLAFWLTLIVVWLLSATIAADYMHPILAIFAGAAFGLLTAGAVYVLVRIWPVIRLLWWWTPEIIASLGLVYGFTVLARHTELPLRLAVIAAVVGVPALIPPIRRTVVAWVRCLIVRHRLRLCFAQFIIANRSGSLPLILWAHPTPVGERVWVWLRPGLSLADLQARLDKITVTCWVSSVTAERASERNAAYVRIDTKRRQVLAADVDSPLVDLVEEPEDIPTKSAAPAAVPAALDLPDVPAATFQPLTPTTGPKPRPDTNGRKPGKPAAASTLSVVPPGGNDFDDWI